MVSIIRAHEPPFEGVELHRFGEPDETFPSVITVFSAPNYHPDSENFYNKGAVLFFENSNMTVEKYKHVDKPLTQYKANKYLKESFRQFSKYF